MTLNATVRTVAGMAALVAAALAVDLLSPKVHGLWPAALLVDLGWLLIWRTEREMEAAFRGPERHRPWLHATGWFFVGAGLLGMVLSLLALVFD